MAKHFELPPDRIADLLAKVLPGNLITVHSDGPIATLVPFYLREDNGQQTLVTHLMRINPQVNQPVTGKAMVIFDKADSYISPLWYATNDKLPNVPTWDYLTVHIWGEVSFDADPVVALKAAEELTLRMEDQTVLDAVGEEKLHKMAKAIVAAEVKVEKIVGKAKMSQNRHPDDIISLIDHIAANGNNEIADYLREVSLPYAEARFGMIEQIRDGCPFNIKSK